MTSMSYGFESRLWHHGINRRKIAMPHDKLYYSVSPILIFIIVALSIALAMAVGGKIISNIVGAYSPSQEKSETFECGFKEFDDARTKFDVRFYLVAILFLIFDLDIAFMIPWGVLVPRSTSGLQISWLAFVAMMFFLLILLVGFVFEWKKGALDWE